MTKKTIGTIAISIIVTLAIVYLPSLLADWSRQFKDIQDVGYCELISWENTEIYDYWGISREDKESRIKWLSAITGNKYELLAGNYVVDNTATEESGRILANFLEGEKDRLFPYRQK